MSKKVLLYLLVIDAVVGLYLFPLSGVRDGMVFMVYSIGGVLVSFATAVIATLFKKTRSNATTLFFNIILLPITFYVCLDISYASENANLAGDDIKYEFEYKGQPYELYLYGKQNSLFRSGQNKYFELAGPDGRWVYVYAGQYERIEENDYLLITEPYVLEHVSSININNGNAEDYLCSDTLIFRNDTLYGLYPTPIVAKPRKSPFSLKTIYKDLLGYIK